ncbi:hypothetical protein [Candidatus Solirubrobacter pratensis]|uniref:hypothetical protein n=1 Tax=Candidatus Solirubrobacter pratensis TaxID=1298857 RepID=UPI000489A260|nr:hypothetical protein [Candidatus Solirubrobacter pratensis]
MLKSTLTAGAAVAVTLVCAASASAKIVEVGRTDAAPACPDSPCLAVSRTTGYQVKVADERNTFAAPEDGKIVAWTITLGKPTDEQTAFFNKSLGGVASARLTVIRLGKKLSARTITQSPVQPLQPFFGQTVQFPLSRALNVKKGDVMALTVPTWAPALTQLLTDHSSWRASRALDKCTDTSSQTAQQRLDTQVQYRCLYKARLTYSATLITRPVPNAAATPTPTPTATPTPTPTPTAGQ